MSAAVAVPRTRRRPLLLGALTGIACGVVALSFWHPWGRGPLGLGPWLQAAATSTDVGERTEYPSTLEGAMLAVRAGETDTAAAILRQIADAPPDETAGAEAVLALGNVLANEHRWSEAVPWLDRARKGPVLTEFARWLFENAVAEGKVAEQEQAAFEDALALSSRGDLPYLLQQHATYELVRLAWRRKDAARTVEAGRAFLARWPDAKHEDEVRWITGQALAERGAFREAHDLFAAVWHETPSSPFARPAKARLETLEAERGLAAWRPGAQQRREFVRSLQKVGLNEDALAEIARYRTQAAAENRLDDALLLEANSLYALRRNEASVRTATEIRRRWPRSPSAPPAALTAIKALRRDDRTEAVRDWTGWLERTFPGRDEARQAQYDFGVHLVNLGRIDDGIARLAPIATGRNVLAQDALWKIAWAERGAGRTERTIERLRDLLARFPGSAYRKGALYWVARFTAASDPVGSRALYRQLLVEVPRDWYGHHARERLAALGEAPSQVGNGRAFPAIDPLDRADRRADSPAYALAVRLKRVGLFSIAAEQLGAMPGVDRDLSLQFALADLYAAAGDGPHASQIVSRSFKDWAVSGSPDPAVVPRAFWQTLYPFRYRRFIEQASSDVDPSLVAALIRNESGFAPHAISAVGAIGLMQVTPAAAAVTARSLGADAPSREDLFEPKTNIRYGTVEIAARVRDFGGALVPAVASYNAGLEPARAWWSKKPQDQEIDEFVETIPYLETRLYVKNVLADRENYRALYVSAKPETGVPPVAPPANANPAPPEVPEPAPTLIPPPPETESDTSAR